MRVASVIAEQFLLLLNDAVSAATARAEARKREAHSLPGALRRLPRLLVSVAILAAVALSAAWAWVDRRSPALVELNAPHGILRVALAEAPQLRARRLSG
jgi:hypothetical protein